MRLSIKAKKPQVLLENIQTFLSANPLLDYTVTQKEHNVYEFIPKEENPLTKSVLFFYLKPLGSKIYLRGEFTQESKNTSLNYSITGTLITAFLHHFKNDIIRLSILSKKPKAILS